MNSEDEKIINGDPTKPEPEGVIYVGGSSVRCDTSELQEAIGKAGAAVRESSATVEADSIKALATLQSMPRVW